MSGREPPPTRETGTVTETFNVTKQQPVTQPETINVSNVTGYTKILQLFNNYFTPDLQGVNILFTIAPRGTGPPMA